MRAKRGRDDDVHGPIAAASVQPGTIEFRTAINGEAELLVRSRPPGLVVLNGGQREHMLLCNRGQAIPGAEVRSTCRVDDTRREWDRLPSGQVTFVPAGTPLEWDWSYHSESVHLILKTDLIAELRQQIESKGRSGERMSPILRCSDEALRRTLLRMRAEALGDTLGRKLALTSLLSMAVVDLVRLASKGGTPRRARGSRLTATQRRRAIAMIDEQLGEGITLGELAGECGLSPHHFSREFKRATGYPPHEFHLRRRIERSRELLLASPHRTIAAIAFELGFSDESHFRRHFKRIVGTTPGLFRR